MVVPVALCLIALCFAVMVLCAATAHAAYYKTLFCGAADGSGNPTLGARPGGFNFTDDCGTAYGDPAGTGGFLRLEENTTGTAGLNDEASYSWWAPPGTSIAAVSAYTREPGDFNQGWRLRLTAEGFDGSENNILIQGYGVQNEGIFAASSGSFGFHAWPFGSSFGDYRRLMFTLTCYRPAGCSREGWNAALAAHKAASPNTGPDDLVFPTENGTVRDKDNLCARVCAAVFKRADELLIARGRVPLPKGLSPHKLRHTFASILIATGVDVASVKEQLGHTDARFTLNIYTHMMARSPEERERLRALVAGEREGHRLAPRRLGWSAFEAPILRVLAARGGRATRRAVIAALAEEMDERLGKADRAPYRGAPRWHVDADLARRHMVKRGLLKETCREGVWALGEEAAERIAPPSATTLAPSDAVGPAATAEREAVPVR